MNETPKSMRQLADEFAVETKALDAILSKGEDMTPADLKQAKAKHAECAALKAQLDGFGDLSVLGSDLAGFKSFRDTPAPRVPLPDGSAAGADLVPGRVDVIGATRAGTCLIDPATKAVVIDNGPGHFGQKAWDAITTPEYREDFWQGYVRGKSRAAVKDLQLGLDEQAGFLAPADFIARIIGRKPYPTSLMGRVSRYTTSRDKVMLPKVQYSSDDIYTTGFRVTKTGEVPASATTASVTDTNLIGIFKIDVDTWMIRAVVTNDMLEDSAFPLEQWLADKFTETIDLLYEDQILNGTGVGAPDGILNNVGATGKPEVVLTGTAGGLDYSGLIDLTTALAPQYDENACFVMSKKGGYRAISKILDNSKRPLFARGITDDGLVNARQMTLLGYPVVFSGFMTDSVDSTHYPVLFGDLRGQYHVDRVGFTLQVLRELYAETNRLVLLGRVRFGGGTAENWRLKIQKANNA